MWQIHKPLKLPDNQLWQKKVKLKTPPHLFENNAHSNKHYGGLNKNKNIQRWLAILFPLESIWLWPRYARTPKATNKTEIYSMSPWAHEQRHTRKSIFVPGFRPSCPVFMILTRRFRVATIRCRTYLFSILHTELATSTMFHPSK